MSQNKREAFATEFGTTDPLARYTEGFERLDADPFELFYERDLLAGNPREGTRRAYDTLLRQYREFMEREGRHPACPNDQHIKDFCWWLGVEHSNTKDTIEGKLTKLNRIFEYMKIESSLPHGTGASKDGDDEAVIGYNPIKLARKTMDLSTFEKQKKETHPITLNELRNTVSEISHLRDRVYIVAQLKLGLRVGELSNIRLQDINIPQSDLTNHYDSLGSHRRVEDEPNALYVPSRYEREGNKSKMSRVLPLDEELRRVFLEYLLIRPDVDEDYVLVSDNHTQVDPKDVNRTWRRYFHPEYAETEDYREVTSHYGRHYFSSYWRLKDRASREQVQYMRGDVLGGKDEADRGKESVDTYLHGHYHEIEDLYRDEIFKLRI